MRYLSLRRFLFLMAVGYLTLMSGCARPTTAVPFVPVVEEARSEVNNDKKLENLPLETLLDNGRTHLRQNNLPLAQLYLFKALTKTSDNVELYQLLGELFMKKNQLDKAKSAFAEVLKLNSEDPSALLGLGKIYRLQGDCIEADHYLQQAQQDNPDVLTEMAICHDTLAQSAQAETLYRKVVELRPRNSSALNNLGFHYLIHGAYPQAIDALLTGAKLKPDDRLIKNNLGAAYILNGDEARGLSLFENSNGEAAAYNNVGYIYMVQNQRQKAEAAFVKALELSPSYYVKAAKNLASLRWLPANP